MQVTKSSLQSETLLSSHQQEQAQNTTAVGSWGSCVPVCDFPVSNLGLDGVCESEETVFYKINGALTPICIINIKTSSLQL